MVSRKMKQTITFIMAFIMLVGTFAGAVFASSPTPINVKSEAERIQDLVQKGYIEGYTDGSLGESKNITRAEFTTIATRALGLEELATTLQNSPTGFKDVSTTAWYNGFIGVARTKNLVQGRSNTVFSPEDNVKYEEALAIMVRMLITPEEKAKVEAGKWPTNYLLKATELGLLKDVNGVTMRQDATRGTVFLILSNVVNIIENKNSTLVDVLVLENTEESLELAVLKASGQFKDRDVLKIKNSKANMEKLSVGDVYTIRITNDKKITSLKANESATATNGEITKNRDELVIGGKKYDTKSLFILNHNGKKEDFKSFPSEINFSKATIYSGKLVYVNAFSFDEVMPIEEVKKERIYGITDTGSTKILNIDKYTNLSLFENGNIKEIEFKDIKSGDIAYIKTDRRDLNIFITQETVKGKIEEVNVKDNSIKVNDKFYKLEAGKSPAILSQGRKYLPIKDVSRLGDMKGNNTEISINLNGNIQLMKADKDISVTNRAIVETIEKDKLNVLTEDGRNETFYVTDYTELLTSRNDRDDRYNRYNVERIMAEIEEGDVIKALVDGRGDIEELEILKGKEGLISNLNYDVMKFNDKVEYLSEDYIVFSLSAGKYSVVKERDFEDIFYSNKKIEIKAIVFERNRDIEVIVMTEVTGGIQQGLLDAVKEAKIVIETANKYKDNKKVESALNSVIKTIEEINANIEKMNEKDIEKYEKLLATGVEKLNKEILVEILAQLSLKIEEVEKTNKIYNKDAFKLVKDYHTKTKSLVKIEDYSKVIKEAEDFLENFNAKVYEDITELDKELNKLEESLELEFKEVARVLNRAVYNKTLVSDYKLFLDRLKNETTNMKDLNTVKMWQTELSNRKKAFDKDKFKLDGVHSNFIEAFMLEERIEVASEMLKIATDSKFDEKTILNGELVKAVRFASSLKNITDAEKIKMDTLEEVDSNLRRALIDLAVKLNIKLSENEASEDKALITKAEAAKISLIASGETDRALELNELIFELKAYFKTHNIEKLSITKIKSEIETFLSSSESQVEDDNEIEDEDENENEDESEEDIEE